MTLISFFGSAVGDRNVAIFVAVGDAVFARNLTPVDQFIFQRRLVDIGFVEKSAEQNEIGEVDTDSDQSGRQRRLARGRGQIFIGARRNVIDVQNVDAKKRTNQKLRYLHGGYERRQKFGALPTSGFHGVVGVHESVYEIIHENAPTPGALFKVVGEPRVGQNRAMVVPVQKDDRPFSTD